MILGITGSIGSGKTTIAKLFCKHGFERIDADKISHELMKNNLQLRKLLIKNFGFKIAAKNKIIDRKKLGEIVFDDEKKLKKLNLIMHPLIILEIKNQIEKIQKKCGGSAKIIVDAPLLLETNAKDLVDKIIVVKCSDNKIIQRLLKKGKRTKKEIMQISKSQMPAKEKLKFADFAVDNGRDLENLERQVVEIMDKLKRNTKLS